MTVEELAIEQAAKTFAGFDKSVDIDFDERYFRGHDCDKYDACLSVAAWTTDYMDCTKCFWYQLSQGEVKSYSFDPVIVFTPKRAESNQKIRALKKLKQLPNAITN